MPVVSHTSIYRYIHRHGLRSQQRSSKRRRKYGVQRPGRFTDRKPISERPSIVQAGTRLGNWEMDTIRPAKGRGVLVTLNERLSGLLRLGGRPTGKADDVSDTVVSCLMPDRSQVHTLTSDRGSEFADGFLIELSLEAQRYMADPHAPWQRARNENLKGLLRQGFPRKRDFSTITQKIFRRPKASPTGGRESATDSSRQSRCSTITNALHFELESAGVRVSDHVTSIPNHLQITPLLTQDK